MISSSLLYTLYDIFTYLLMINAVVMVATIFIAGVIELPHNFANYMLSKLIEEKKEIVEQVSLLENKVEMHIENELGITMSRLKK